MIWDILILPMLLGLLGFFEPCSLGVNTIFVNYIRRFDVPVRIAETILFTIVRAIVLSLVGLSVAVIGRKFFVFQQTYFLGLGAFFIVVGIFAILRRAKKISIPTINLLRFVKKKNTISMAILFGLMIPACAIPLILALLGKSLLTGSVVKGWVSLFVFGVALSAPLILISASDRAHTLLEKMGRVVRKVPYLSGTILIVLGIITMLSNVWWAG